MSEPTVRGRMPNVPPPITSAVPPPPPPRLQRRTLVEHRLAGWPDGRPVLSPELLHYQNVGQTIDGIAALSLGAVLAFAISRRPVAAVAAFAVGVLGVGHVSKRYGNEALEAALATQRDVPEER